MAVRTERQAYSYADLSAMSAAYADGLRRAGVGRGARVLVVVDPGVEAVALLCACGALGAVWVPTSPENPASRIRAVFDAVAPGAVVCGPGAAAVTREAMVNASAALAHADGPVLRWEVETGAKAADVVDVLEIDTAYIVFTSGSTGRPKGIVMSHRAATGFFDALVDYNSLAGPDVVGSISPVQFDFWLLDTALALGSGASIAYLPRRFFFQPRRFAQHMQAMGVTQMNGVPSLWPAMLAHAPDQLRAVTTLRSIFFAGEPFPLPQLRRLRGLFPALRIINCFGHSESIACAFADVPIPLDESVSRLTFGRGHRGVELMVVGEDGRLVTTPGLSGELYLRAPTLFSGYWDDAEATARALVPNPVERRTGERVFKSGDVVCLGEAGELYFVGRSDDQIKVMGNRVELGDIAAAVRQMPGIAEAAAGTVTGASGLQPTIAVWIVLESGSRLRAEQVRAWCLQQLPRHMVPAEIHTIGHLPLTRNGKVDMHALKEMRLPVAAASAGLPGAGAVSEVKR